GAVSSAFAPQSAEGPYHGWILGYDAKTLRQALVYMTTPEGAAGGVWMAGMAPAIDDDGSIYLTTGNGRNTMALQTGLGYKGGESVLKLQNTGSALTLVDWFTPSTYALLERHDRDLSGCGAL